MTSIDPATITERRDEYLDREAFAVVEEERRETLPTAFAEGSYLWKDCEWIVRWYVRRPLEGRRDEAERAFRNNAMDAIERAIDGAVDGNSTAHRLEALLALDGVDVEIASAYLQFIDPMVFAAIAEPPWRALHRAGDLETTYPEPVRPSDYERYLDVSRQYAEKTDLPAIDVGRALWRLGTDDEWATQ